MENKINEIKLDNTRNVLIIGSNFNNDTISDFLINPDECHVVSFTDDEQSFIFNGEHFDSYGYNTIIYKDNLTKTGIDLITESIRMYEEEEETGITAFIELENCSSIQYLLEFEKNEKLFTFEANIKGEEGIMYELDHIVLSESMLEEFGDDTVDILDDCDGFDIRVVTDGTIVKTYSCIDLDFWN